MNGRPHAPRLLPWVICVITVVAMVPTSAPAQDSTNRTRIAVGQGLVLGGGGGVDGGFGYSLEMIYQHAPHQVALRGLAMITIAGHFDGGAVESGDLVEVGLTYGRTRVGRRGYVALSGGVSSVHFTRCEGPQRRGCTVFGIPLTVEAAAHSKIVGIRAQGFVNLNQKSIYGGLAISMLLGWMPR